MAETKQLSIFDFTQLNDEASYEIRVEIAKAKEVAEKNAVPSVLTDLMKQTDFNEVLKMIAQIRHSADPHPSCTFKLHYRDSYEYSSSDGYIDIEQEVRTEPVLKINVTDWHECSSFSSRLAYVDENGNAWESLISLILENGLPHGWNSLECLADPKYRHIKVEGLSFGKWKKLEKFVDPQEYYVLNKTEDIWTILQKTNPWGYQFASDKRMKDPFRMITCPQLEQLSKAGFVFADRLLDRTAFGRTELDCFNRLAKRGSKIKDILKTSKNVYTILKNERDLAKWDIYRKLDKTGKMDKDTIQQSYDTGYGEKELRQINNILSKEYDGKKIFTWESLLNYLRRLDMYEAISSEEAFVLLSDYLSMCNQLRVEPRIDGDSLKREHDVMARTFRLHRNEIVAENMKRSCDKLSAYDYENDKYLIRGIRDYDDLLDEAKQQHNCVASYAPAITSGRSLIFVMRDKSTPDTSLITVELSPDGRYIRQRYLRYNQPIHNKEQSTFLDEWQKLVKRCKDEKYPSIKEMLSDKKLQNYQNKISI